MSRLRKPNVPTKPSQPVLKSYFSDVLIVVYFLPSVVPRPFTAATIAIEMPAAISAYSMALAVDSSFKKRAKIPMENLFAFLAYGKSRREKLARIWVTYFKREYRKFNSTRR